MVGVAVRPAYRGGENQERAIRATEEGEGSRARTRGASAVFSLPSFLPSGSTQLLYSLVDKIKRYGLAQKCSHCSGELPLVLVAEEEIVACLEYGKGRKIIRIRGRADCQSPSVT